MYGWVDTRERIFNQHGAYRGENGMQRETSLWDAETVRNMRDAATRKEILPIMVVKKIKLPRFNGEEPTGWILKLNLFWSLEYFRSEDCVQPN